MLLVVVVVCVLIWFDFLLWWMGEKQDNKSRVHVYVYGLDTEASKLRISEGKNMSFAKLAKTLLSQKTNQEN